MNALIDAAGWTFLHFLWQGAAIAALLALFLGLGSCSSRVRYLAACVALLAMAAR